MQGQPTVHNVSVMSKARKIPEGKQLYSYMYGIQQLHVITSKHDYIKQNTTYRIGIRAEKVSKKMFCPKIFLNSDFELSV